MRGEVPIGQLSLPAPSQYVEAICITADIVTSTLISERMQTSDGVRLDGIESVSTLSSRRYDFRAWLQRQPCGSCGWTGLIGVSAICRG